MIRSVLARQEVCRAVIDALVLAALLRWTPTGAIARTES
jgi:hypothetical protein